MSALPNPENEDDAALAGAGVVNVCPIDAGNRMKTTMKGFDAGRNPAPVDEARVPRAANCNHQTPIRWGASLEEASPAEMRLYVSAVAELVAALATYCPIKEDARDMRGATALIYDVRNRMARRGGLV